MGSIKTSMRFIPQEVKIYRPNKNRISTTLLNCIDRSTIEAQKFFIRVADFDDAEVGFYMLYCQSSNIYVLFGTWEENKGCAYFSNDGKNWGWGIETPFIQLDINLGDGSWLGFGTWSKSDGGISAETTVIDISKVTSKYLQPANLESMPEYGEIEGVFP